MHKQQLFGIKQMTMASSKLSQIYDSSQWEVGKTGHLLPT